MSLYLFIVFVSFIVNSVLIIPFINSLYQLKLQRKQQQTKDAFNLPTPIFDKFNRHKIGTPVGGGILLILTTVAVFSFFIGLFTFFNKTIIANYPSVSSEIKIILFSFIAFGALGLYDDLRKIFLWEKEQFFGIRLRHKLILEIILALIIGFWLFNDLKINIINIPFLGVYNLSFFYILFVVSSCVDIADKIC